MVATAQQLTGVARGLAERGHSVTVITSRRGYDDAELRFPARERWQGIEIIRLPSIALGKTSRWRRALNFASFSAACAFRLALTRPQDTVIALTSPPLISWLASLFTRMKGGRMVFWVMDLNPDEAIAAGWLKPNSLTAKLLSALLQSSMQHAEKIIVLDRFMKERIAAKGISAQKIEVIPPSQDNSVNYDREGREAFRRRHGLSEKFVVMYAGNHSPCHPLDTLLEAAKKLSARDDIAFCFVGGGSEFSKVEEFARANQLENIRCLPYQPQAELSGCFRLPIFMWSSWARDIRASFIRARYITSWRLDRRFSTSALSRATWVRLFPVYRRDKAFFGTTRPGGRCSQMHLRQR